MTIDIYKNIRILTVGEISTEWYKDRTVGPRQTILAELKRAHELFNSNRSWRDEGIPEASSLTRLSEFPDGSDSWELTKEEVEEFCEKQAWPLPRFWFPQVDDVVRSRGRPSTKKVYIDKFLSRKENDECLTSITEEARWLLDWYISAGHKPIQVRTIAKNIRPHFY